MSKSSPAPAASQAPPSQGTTPKKRRGITTRKSLIQRVQEEGDRASWHDFYHTYDGFIISIAMKMGLGSHDAEDVMSQVFDEVHRKFVADDALDFETQSFGGWLGNLVKWRVLDFFRKQKNQGISMDDEYLELLATEKPFEEIWNKEWHRKLMKMALSRVRETPRNLLIFCDLALHETPMATVCERYGISRTNADTIKQRVKQKLAPIVRKLDNAEL